MSKINQKLAAAIRDSGLMKNSLAERAGLSSPSRLSQILNGSREPNKKEEIGLAAALNVKIDDLF